MRIPSHVQAGAYSDQNQRSGHDHQKKMLRHVSSEQMVIEVRGWRRVAGPFVVLGVTALPLFFLSSFMARLLLLIRVGPERVRLHAWLFEHLFAPWASPFNASLAFAICYLALWTLVPIYNIIMVALEALIGRNHSRFQTGGFIFGEMRIENEQDAAVVFAREFADHQGTRARRSFPVNVTRAVIGKVIPQRI